MQDPGLLVERLGYTGAATQGVWSDHTWAIYKENSQLSHAIVSIATSCHAYVQSEQEIDDQYLCHDVSQNTCRKFRFTSFKHFIVDIII